MGELPDVTRHVHPVLPARELGTGPVRVRLAGRDYVLWRDGSGRPAGAVDRCPHRFAPLSAGRVRPDGRLACGYHGWHFDREGAGISPGNPRLSRCDVPALQVVEHHDYLWASAPEVEDRLETELPGDGFQFNGAFARRFPAPLHVVLDNFSEDEHVPYVHHFLGFDEAGFQDISFTAERHDDRSEVHYVAPQRPSPWLRFVLIRRGDRFHNDWVTRFSPVHTVYTIHWTDPDTGRPRPLVARIPIFFVPESEDATWVHTFSFSKLVDNRYRPLLPIIRRVALRLAQGEIDDDARFIGNVAATPEDLSGMRLDRFDEPVIHNRKLLRELYWGRPRAVDVGQETG